MRKMKHVKIMEHYKTLKLEEHHILKMKKTKIKSKLDLNLTENCFSLGATFAAEREKERKNKPKNEDNSTKTKRKINKNKRK